VHDWGVFVHDVAQSLVFFGKNKIVQVDRANEFALFVADENGVDGFSFAANRSHGIDGVAHRFVFEEFQVLGRHDGAGGIGFVL